MNLKEYIRSIPDYPKKGILFRDITLIKNEDAFEETINQIIKILKNHKFDKKQAEENDKAYKRWKEARKSNLEQTTQSKLEKKTLPDD